VQILTKNKVGLYSRMTLAERDYHRMHILISMNIQWVYFWMTYDIYLLTKSLVKISHEKRCDLVFMDGGNICT
jgi:hypothetical protein